MAVETFEDVLAAIKKNKNRQFHLLLGNGFSMAYDSTIFSYNALHEFISKLEDKDLLAVLGVVETKNFEIVMQYLDTFSSLLDAFGRYPKLKRRVEDASTKLKNGLLDSVRALHPEHVFKVPEDQSQACSRLLKVFLESGGHIYSTNYDLLLYWVLMRNAIVDHVDGCGRELENDSAEYVPAEEQVWSELIWGPNREQQNVFYLHGALPFFDNGVDIAKEQYDVYNYLLQKISTRMENGEYPVFVAAGDGREKLEHIMHNRYLTYCYESLSAASGSLVTFGFNFGPNDDHIIGAINKAASQGPAEKLWSIYIGAYSEDDRKHIENIRDKFRCKVHIYDAKTADFWGHHGVET